MKRFFTFAILTTINIIAISAQNEYCIAKIDNNSNIIVCNNMIDAFSAEDIINVKQFSITNHSNIFVNEKKYDINIGCINDWDNYDGGMFNVISVSKDNNTLLEIKQPDCWTFTYGGKSETDFHKYTNNQYYIPIEISNNLSILIFVGWPYGGEWPSSAVKYNSPPILLSISKLWHRLVKRLFCAEMDWKLILPFACSPLCSIN